MRQRCQNEQSDTASTMVIPELGETEREIKRDDIDHKTGICPTLALTRAGEREIMQ